MKKIKKVIVLLTLFAALFSLAASSKNFLYIDAHPSVLQNSPEKFDDDIPLPVIMYHSTAKINPNCYNIKPETFEKDIIYLLEHKYTPVNISDLIKWSIGEALPEKPVMITFDDGYANNYYNIFPLVKKYNIKIIMSVIGKLIDDNYEKNGSLIATMSHVTYEQITEMHKSGLVEIQNHTYNLHISGNRKGMGKQRDEDSEKYAGVLKEDLNKLQGKLWEKCGINCTAVAFPYGNYNEETLKIVKDLGFSAAFTCREKINLINSSSGFFKLNRFNRPSGKSSADFFKKCGVE